jgi:hypothetical protein
VPSYATSIEELKHALMLNMGAFVAGLILWSLCCCFGLSRGDGHRSQGGAEAPKRNYLSFLLISAYTFVALSIVNSVFIYAHELGGHVFVGGWGILLLNGQVNYGALFVMTVLDGGIVLFAAHVFRRLIMVAPAIEGADRMRRTIWLRGLPTHDSMRWWHSFQLNDMEISRVRRDLSDAVTDFLLEHGPPSDSQSGTGSAPEQPAASSLPIELARYRRPVAAKAGLTCPPVDLALTQWKCQLQRGNPYYVNTATGVTQWRFPEELLQPSNNPAGALRNHSIVEEVQVGLVVDEWERVHSELSLAREYTEAYFASLGRARAELGDVHCSFMRARVLGALSYWYERRRDAWSREVERLEAELQRINGEKKELSGSAFVTLTQPNYRDFIFREEDLQSLVLNSNVYFSFGHPPFASVTLMCESAPHPSDIIWQNLHVTRWRRSTVFWSLMVLLLFVTVVVVTVVRISEIVQPFLDFLRVELDALQRTEAWKKFFPASVDHLLSKLNTDHVWQSAFKQVPTMILLFINSVVLPTVIAAISSSERSVKHSDAELRRMSANFFFLFMNTVVVPFCGVASLDELFSIAEAKLSNERLDPSVYLQGLTLAAPGLFTLKYLLHVTFLSNLNQLLQAPQCFSRWFLRKFVAVTPRERVAMGKPWAFYWGYWYAWSLSVVALGLTMSIACPVTLHVTALFFLPSILWMATTLSPVASTRWAPTLRAA